MAPLPKEERDAKKLEIARERFNIQRERLVAANERLIAARRAISELTQQLNELRNSYYLSGAAKKLDLRQIDGFSDIAQLTISEGRSGMNFDRLYTIWQALQGAPIGPPIVEVGVFRGGSAKFIIETLRRAGRSPRVYVCDTFTGHPLIDEGLDRMRSGSNVRPEDYKFEDTSLESVAEYLEGYTGLDIVAGDILKTSDRLPPGPYAFVHIDVDVYHATDFCVRFFAPRLAPGAVMVVDDYGFITCPGAKKAIDDFIAESTEYRLFHLLTGQALLYRQA